VHWLKLTSLLHLKLVVPEVKEVDRPQAYFILEHELRKINIPVPLSELLKNEPFKQSIMKVLQPPTSVVTYDVISLQDENPTITVGPHIEDGSDASPPFYISLNVHERSYITVSWTQVPHTMSCLRLLWRN
jgi:hypothetical protein